MNTQPSFDVYSIFFLLGAAQAAFLAVALLIIKHGNRIANRFLVAFLMALSILLLTVVAYHTKYILIYPHLIRIEAPLIFVYGPLFFLYIKALASKRFVFEKRYLLHFVPVVIYAGYLFPFYVQNEADKINYWTASHTHNLPLHMQVEAALGIGHLLAYVILAVGLLVKHKWTIKESFSSIEKINLAWIRNLLIGLGVIWAGYFVTYSFEVDWLIHIVALLIVGMIYYMGFKGLIQPEIFTADEERQPASKYAKSALTPDKAEAYLEKLLRLMETEKPFTDS
ncbi:MAG: hypothetical protein ACRENG_38770, partial [bacterium]